MQLTQHDHDEEGGGEPHGGHHQTIARVETELWVETEAWTVGGDCSAETGGDWGWEDARPAAGGGPASRGLQAPI